MKKRTWKVIAVISFAAAVILTAVVLRIYTQREHARQTYEEMQQQNSEKRQTDTQESKEQSKTKKKKKKLDIPVDFETLQKENPDIYAWITIPGTDIDYPVVQDSTDNTYYLNHAADTSLSDSGAIYSEKENAKDFDDYLTVLYGHNMKDGSMFAGLHKYEDKTFLKDHKDLTIYTPDSILKYRIFAAYLTDNRHVLMYYNQGKDEESRETYLKDILEQRNMNASIDTKAKVDKDSKILTLSTCHAAGKNYRYLVSRAAVFSTFLKCGCGRKLLISEPNRNVSPICA